MNKDITTIEFEDIVEFLESDHSNQDKLDYLWSLKLNMSRLVDSIARIEIDELPALSKDHKYYKNRPFLYELLTNEFGVNFANHDNTEDSLVIFFRLTRKKYTDLLKRIDKEIPYFSQNNTIKQDPPKAKIVRQKKVKWLGTEGEIAYLFELLYNEGYLEKSFYHERYSVIAQLFLNKNGIEFDNKQLSQAVRILRNNKPRNSENLKNLVKEIRKK